MLKNLLSRVTGSRPSSAKPQQEAAPAPESRPTPAVDGGDSKEVKQVVPESGDTEVKIQFSRCDLHPLYPLRDIAIYTLLADSTDSTKSRASCCTKPACKRHYLPEFGYFEFVAGEKPNFGDMQAKPKCEKHDLGYMV